MGAFALPIMALAILALVTATGWLTFRDHKREKAQELEAARQTGHMTTTGLETRRYRSKPGS